MKDIIMKVRHIMKVKSLLMQSLELYNENSTE